MLPVRGRQGHPPAQAMWRQEPPWTRARRRWRCAVRTGPPAERTPRTTSGTRRRQGTWARGIESRSTGRWWLFPSRGGTPAAARRCSKRTCLASSRRRPWVACTARRCRRPRRPRRGKRHPARGGDSGGGPPAWRRLLVSTRAPGPTADRASRARARTRRHLGPSCEGASRVRPHNFNIPERNTCMLMAVRSHRATFPRRFAVCDVYGRRRSITTEVCCIATTTSAGARARASPPAGP